MIGYRNKVLAARAWHENKDCFKNRRHRGDFENGFMQGYIDVANGGNGCVPAVAPASYLSWRYQSADGQNAINAWFAGYPLGAQAAEQDGVGHWGMIRPTGPNKPREAVYVPPMPPVDEVDENPFYRESYPVPAPAVEQPMEDEDDAAGSPSDDPVRDAIDNTMKDDSNPVDDLKEKAGDAIRDALESGLDDSTFVPSQGTQYGYSATFSDATPTANAVQEFFQEQQAPSVASEDDPIKFRFE